MNFEMLGRKVSSKQSLLPAFTDSGKCIEGNQNECENVERTGIPTLVQVCPVQATTQMMTRNVLKQQALQTANLCVFGNFIAIKFFNHSQASFMIGMVIGEVVLVDRTCCVACFSQFPILFVIKLDKG